MKLGLILGDQLSRSLPTLHKLDRKRDCLLLAEVGAEAQYVWHHKQKLLLLFSAMRHFAEELRADGWTVHYHRYDPQHPSLSLFDVLQYHVERCGIKEVLVTECGEYRLHADMQYRWASSLQSPLTLLEDQRFFCSKNDFAKWADGRRQLRMEYFYRVMRRQSGLLMDGESPEGGKWNYDSSNRKPWRGKPELPPMPVFKPDSITQEVMRLVEEQFPDHPGEIERFNWPVNRDQALQALHDFIKYRLPYFGDFQDALSQNESFLFHSLLSPAINCGLLNAREVCEAAEQAYDQGHAPLNAVEGFIRQILGWREYVRGVYWLLMPEYASRNVLAADRSLPRFYWTGETRMNCMRRCFDNTFTHAYAHHIQRLMVTGNFALLAGIRPTEICDWYLAVYADAYDWVELPNTLGMVLHADGAVMGSKPYAASGSYIHRMSDYCKHCHYDVKTGTEADSCPFNSLYWHFIDQHRERFADNPRMSMIHRNWDRMPAERRQALLNRAGELLENIETL